MKKLMMAIVCLMTTVISVNAQRYDETIWGNFVVMYSGDKMFSFGTTGNSIFNNHIEKNRTLYQGTVDGMAKIFTKILNKSREWNRICVEDKAPSIEKKIGEYGDFYAFFSYGEHYKEYNVRFYPKDEYSNYEDLSIIYGGFSLSESELICVIRRLGGIDVDRYVEEDIKKEERRKIWQEKEERKKAILGKLN